MLVSAGSKKDGITVAWLWPRYEGYVSSRASVIIGFDRKLFKTVIVYLMKNSDKANLFEDNGYETFYMSARRYFRIFNFPVIWKLRGTLKQQNVDILQTHGHLATVYGVIAGKLAGVPVVFSHVPGLNRSKRPRRKFINRFIFRWVGKILTTGQAVKDDVLANNSGVMGDQVISLGNSIDCSRFDNIEIDKRQAKDSLGLSAESFVFGSIGRFTATKGYSSLIEAFAAVKARLSGAHLVLVGRGRLLDDMKAKAREAGLDDSVHFLGQRDDIPSLLRAMDVFVLASVAEGMPRALLEAMAAGVGCVATRVGGVPEIFEEGRYGFLAEPDDPESLAERMLEVANMDEESRSEFAEKAGNHVRAQYSDEVMTGRLVNIYIKEVIGKWTFSEYLKRGVDLVELEDREMPLEDLAVQYNPDRFEVYKSLHSGPPGSVLDMKFSPHCRLLREYQKRGDRIWSSIKQQDYYRMQRLFGKSGKSALAKAKRLIDLFEDIKGSGFNSRIIVSDKPAVANEYNSGYEIYTGHHRVACCIVLGFEAIPCQMVRIRKKHPEDNVGETGDDYREPAVHVLP